MELTWAIVTASTLIILIIRYLSGKNMLHGSALLFGFAFYCTLPFVVYGFDLFHNGPGYEFWSKEFAPAYRNSFYIILYFVFSCMFYGIGQLMPVLRIRKQIKGQLSIKLLRFLLLIIAVAWIWFVLQARDYLFVGYGADYRPELMGPLATVNLLLTLIILSMRQQLAKCWTAGGYLLLLMLNSIVLLSMGGRMYVMVALVSLFIQHINDTTRKTTARIKLVILLSAGILALAMIGLWRIEQNFDWQLLWVTAIAEPILTSISLGSYIECGDLNLLNIPWNFFGSILNFIPSVLLSNKNEILPQLDPSGFCLNSPFGATHIFSALLGNFGIIGSLFFILLFSWFLRLIKVNRDECGWFYYYVCGLLPFMFFRDGFLIFNKALIGTGLLSALVFVTLSRISLR